MNTKEYDIIQDPVFGYRRLDPIPHDDEIAEFYKSRYYELIRKGGRAPELRRFMAGGEEELATYWRFDIPPFLSMEQQRTQSTP